MGHLDNYVPEPEMHSGTSSQDAFEAEASILEFGGGQMTRTPTVEFSFRYEDSPVAGSIELMTVGKDRSSEVRHGTKVTLSKKIMLRECLHFYWVAGSEVKGHGRFSEIKS